MALIQCDECTKEVSDKASSCPHCGCPLREETGEQVLKVATTFNRFATIFVIAMVPTYLLRLAVLKLAFDGSDSLMAQTDAMHWIFGLCYLFMVGITKKRGDAVNKPYAVVFPILSGIFDIILIHIPFVPTLLNLITLFILRPEGKEVAIPDEDTHIKSNYMFNDKGFKE